MGVDLTHWLRSGDWDVTTLRFDFLRHADWIGWNRIVNAMALTPVWIYAGVGGAFLGCLALSGLEEIRRSRETRAWFRQSTGRRGP
jgi:hypothetical protein